MLPTSRKSPKSRSSTSFNPLLIIIVTAVPSFFLGSLTGMSSCLECQSKCTGSESEVHAKLMESTSEKHEPCDEVIPEVPQVGGETSVLIDFSQILPDHTVGRYLNAATLIEKDQLTSIMDFGVPLDHTDKGQSDVLLLYNRHATPDALESHMEALPALEKCDFVNVILTEHGSDRRQCIAIVPQYESYHIQKWMKTDDKGVFNKDLKHWSLVSRGRQSNNKDSFKPPELSDTQKHWSMLKNYLETLDDVVAELKPILEKIAVDNTVIVMVCNFGQAELLMNFVCSAHSRGMDLRNIIVFVTDQETFDIATGLGLTAYYDKRNFGDIPAEAAKRYGDRRFVAMMMAKVICVQLVSMLGFDFLFQDVDIVWYKNPLEYFKDPQSPAVEYDIFFQDDGGHSVRYAPYSANSGFYFVRHNDRTRHFLTSLLMAGDLVLKTDSHQQALIALLAEHVSLYGLRAKVLSRDMEEFPGGYQWNMKSGKYMRALFAGEINPIIFHMSWTLNKDNKLLYFRQMGEWYVEETCIQKKVEDIVSEQSTSSDLTPVCCSREPLFSCHYRDKPSVKPCWDSPNIDKGRPSFWPETKRAPV